MSERRRGLGRGLGALLPAARSDGDTPNDERPMAVAVPPDARSDLGVGHGRGADVATGQTGSDQVPTSAARDDAPAGARFAELPVESIRPNPRQPRQEFDQDALDELVSSIREVGILQPIVVRAISGEDRAYELVMGERRLRAARAAGLAHVPAIVRETSDDALLLDALLENIHRAQLNPLEEAAAYDQLLHDFGCTQDELASRVGRSRPQVTNTIRLLRLAPSVQRRLAAGVLTAGHGRALLGLPDAAAQERLAQRIVAEGLSVRSVEEIVALGGEPDRVPGPRRRSHRPVAPALVDLAARLSDRFETRVKVDLGRHKGRITVEFASLADLERIVEMIDPRQALPVLDDGGRGASTPDAPDRDSSEFPAPAGSDPGAADFHDRRDPSESGLPRADETAHPTEEALRAEDARAPDQSMTNSSAPEPADGSAHQASADVGRWRADWASVPA